MTKPKNAHYYINVGHYNICGTNKSASLQLITSGGNFSALFEVDEAPDVDGLLPSEVLDLIEARIDSYWISTGREDTKKRIKEWRKEQRDFDAAWLEKRIEATEKTLVSLKRELQNVRDAQADEEV